MSIGVQNLRHWLQAFLTKNEVNTQVFKPYTTRSFSASFQRHTVFLYYQQILWKCDWNEKVGTFDKFYTKYIAKDDENCE